MVKQVIVLRKDLNMRKGKMAAQAAHASMKVLLDSARPLERTSAGGTVELTLWPEAVEWLAGLFTKVVVGCDSEAELLALQRTATDARLKTALIQDSGLTEFGGVPTYTALAIGPHEAGRFEGVTAHLKLL